MIKISLRNLRSLIRETVLNEGSTAEAWWTTPEGEIVDVPIGSYHDEVAARLMGIENPKELDDDKYTFAYAASGAIRMRKSDGALLVTMSELTRRSLDTLKRGIEKLNLPMRMNVFLDIDNVSSRTTVDKLFSANNPRDL
jgi:hypothetical protein